MPRRYACRPAQHRGFRRVVPVSVALCSPFLAIWAVGLAAGLPLNLPDSLDPIFLPISYGWAILFAMVLQLVAFRRSRQHRHLVLLRLFPFLILATFLHFQFKGWMVFAPEVHDHALFTLEHDLQNWTAAVPRKAHGTFGWSAGVLDRLYMVVFLTMFFLSGSLHALLDDETGQRRLFYGIALILMLGGVSYWAFPALGPFVFRGGGSPFADAQQQYMLHAWISARRSGSYPAAFFVIPLAAMPSLHVAHSVHFTLRAMASRRLTWLAKLYVPLTAFIFAEAWLSGWHYLLDLPAGLALSALVFVGLQLSVPARFGEGVDRSEIPGAAADEEAA